MRIIKMSWKVHIKRAKNFSNILDKSVLPEPYFKTKTDGKT